MEEEHKIISDIFVFRRAAYVTHEDICRSFRGDTLLAIQAPSGTQLEVPIPEVVSSAKDD